MKIVIPKYLKKVQVSKKRRAKYYDKISQIKSKKILQKIKDDVYRWQLVKGKDVLHDEFGMPVIANPL